MFIIADEADKTRSRSWMTAWDPEDEAAWESGGKKVAWRSLWVTTFALTLAFAVWFMVSALVVRLPDAGFGWLTTGQLFWLAAMPGLAAGTLRIVHTFLIPIFGSRHTVSISTALLAIPVVGWFFAVQNPDTPFAVLMLLAFLAGLGGGNFSSFMPSTSLYFPKRLQGTALAVQAGVGNFGVSLVQFLTPVLIGTAIFGGVFGGAQVLSTATGERQIWLQNAAIIWLPLVVIAAAVCWFWLRSVPVRANFREQADIFRSRHTWIMTSLYFMTFGSFSGLAAAFPMLIRDTYGVFDGAPDPLRFAFLGPLVGSLVRVLAGPVSDRLGGARVTQISAIGLTGSAIAVTFFLQPTSLEQFPLFVWSMLALFFFAGVGNASTFKQIPMLFEKRQAGGVIGWTAAIGAYGPFVIAGVIGAVIGATGSAAPFFWGLAIFFAANTVLNWYFYARRNAPSPC